MADTRTQWHTPVASEKFKAEMFRKLETCQTVSNAITFSIQWEEISFVGSWFSEKYRH
jgi:hypothetical protein